MFVSGILVSEAENKPAAVAILRPQGEMEITYLILPVINDFIQINTIKGLGKRNVFLPVFIHVTERKKIAASEVLPYY